METIGALAGGFAHDFNNLLQTALGYARFALKALDDSHTARPDLLVAVTAAERAATLTRRLLDLSRAESRPAEPFDVDAAVRECATFLRPLLDDNIQMELALDDALQPFFGDLGDFQLMLMNLCLNARDAMPCGGRIVISASETTLEKDAAADASGLPRAGRCLELSVADTGCGVSPEIKRRIFEPFYTTKPAGAGTGLGLALVRSTALRHGGSVEVRSEPGLGARFVVRLPFAGQDESEDCGLLPLYGVAYGADDEPGLLERVPGETCTIDESISAIRDVLEGATSC